MACYDGPNPVKEEERYAIWKWAKEHGGIDSGASYDQVHKSINDYFFAGQARPEWIHDILSGRKTPFRNISKEAWRRQYNRRAIVQQAEQFSQLGSLGPIGRAVMKMRYLPRAITVAGHGIVFPVTHAGELLLTPSRWGTFVKGMLRTYRAAGSSAYAARALAQMEARPMFDMALRSGLDAGPKSHPVGIIGSGGKTGYFGAASRAWDMLTTMRYELWEKQMSKYVKPGMTDSEILDYGKQLAEWANHATGSGKGKIADIGGGTLFGPKLTQSKINRLTSDPAKTIKTFSRWKEATPGEKAVAWTRLGGAAQYATSLLGFLTVNQAVLGALGSKQKINFTDPTKGDFWAFKGLGVAGYIPGMHTEIRFLAKLLNIAYTEARVPGKRKPLVSNPALHGSTKYSAFTDAVKDYAMAKLEPGVQRGIEVATGENYQGRPLPWSKDQGTPKKPRLTWGEYAGSVGPIPLEGPIGYVYDQMKNNGASPKDALASVKALIIFGGGLPGFHVHEDAEAQKR